MSKEVNIDITLDRAKVLDEGIFLAICGLEQCRANQFITGVVRLKLAVERIQLAIDSIKDMNK